LIPACKWVKAACRRQLDDLEREQDPTWPYEWRRELADRVIRFIELLPHVKGPLAGEPLRLERWQKFGIACVFGWVRKTDGRRRFRTVYDEEPRKNAKTTKLAGIGLYMLVADDELGAEVYSAATKEEQARIVFEIAQQMARMEPEFRAHFGVEIYRKALAVRDTASKFRPLAADADSLDGLNVSCALIDELHAHKTRAVHDVLDSGTGSRAQPLIWKITTAGSNRAGVCYDQRNYLTKILNAVLKRHGGMGYRIDGECVDNENFWGIIYTVDEGDDLFDEATWRKANPNWGVSVEPDDMRRMAAVARVQAQALNEFLTKRLNVWVNADSAWMNMLEWDACGDLGLRLEDFKSEECVVALDAAFKKDLFAKVRMFRRLVDEVALKAIGKAPVLVTINSPGGDAFEGIAIYNLLREHQGKITCNVIGLAASAGSIIAMAGDEIRMGAAAMMMIHSSHGVVVGNQEDMREFADLLDSIDRAVAGLYAARTGKSEADVLELMKKETWMTGPEAVKAGFADVAASGRQEEAEVRRRTPVFASVPGAARRVRRSAASGGAPEHSPPGASGSQSNHEGKT
jgi:phage terminase large subunit-like protein